MFSYLHCRFFLQTLYYYLCFRYFLNMTIKSRTNITLALFILSCVTMLLYIGSIIFQVLTNNLSFPEAYFLSTPKSSFVFGYNQKIVLHNVFIELLYVMIVTFIMFRSFAKTQSTIVLFFFLYMFAIYADTFRLLIPIFHISNSYSQTLVAIGEITLFARILAPIALLATSLLHFDEQHQNANKYAIICIFIALMLASLIPLNTTKIRPNFTVYNGFSNAVVYASVIAMIFGALSLIISNAKSEKRQITAIGFGLVCIGTCMLFNCYSLFTTVITYILLGVGTTLYLYNLHKEYLMN